MTANPQRTPAGGDTEDMLPQREAQFPPTVHWAHRRPFGLGPAALLAGLGGITFVIAIVLFALGSWAAAIVLLALSGAAVCLFLVAVRREPEAQSARLAVTAAGRANGLVRLISVAVRASSHAALELTRIWGWRRRLRMQFKRGLTPLGEAVYRDDLARAAQLKAQARQLDQALDEADRRAAEAKGTLREQIERERATSQRTQQLAVLEGEPSPDLDGRG